MASKHTGGHEYPSDLKLRIAPDGLSAVVEVGKTRFSWYALPTGELIQDSMDFAGVSLLEFSQTGLSWLQDKKTVFDVQPDRTRWELPAPQESEAWTDMYVAGKYKAVATLHKGEDSSHLQVFIPLEGKAATFDATVPLAESMELQADDGMNLLAVVGENGAKGTRRVDFFRRHPDRLEKMLVRSGGVDLRPAMGHGLVAWAEKDGIRLLDGMGKLQVFPGNESDQVQFFLEGTRLLSTRVIKEVPGANVKVLVRLFSTETFKLLRSREIIAGVRHRFLIGPTEDLFSIYVDHLGTPVITPWPWRVAE